MNGKHKHEVWACHLAYLPPLRTPPVREESHVASSVPELLRNTGDDSKIWGTRMRGRLSVNSMLSLPNTERTSQFPSASALTGGLSSLRFSAVDRERLAFWQLHRILSLSLSPLQFRRHQAPLCGPVFLPCDTRVKQWTHTPPHSWSWLGSMRSIIFSKPHKAQHPV